jgi:hypothetical protein
MEFKERFEEREELVFEELRRMASPHVEASDGLFTLLDHDEESYPAQSLRTWHVDGNPQDAGTVKWIARGIEPRFDIFTDVLAESESSASEISRIGEQLEKDQNIILVTNHGDLKDIAYTLAAYYVKLKEQRYDFRSSLVMSKIISFIGVGEDGDSAVNILKNICDEEYFSFPRTKSINQSRIAGGLVTAYNEGVRKVMERRLHKGGNLFAMAASGTTDKPLEDDQSTISMGRIGHGTVKLMAAPNSLVLPIAVWLTPEDVVFKPCDIPRAINEDEEAHDVMALIAQTLTDSVPDTKFVYSA